MLVITSYICQWGKHTYIHTYIIIIIIIMRQDHQLPAQLGLHVVDAARCNDIHTYIHTFPSGVVHISDTEVTRERTVVVRQCIGTTPSAGL